MTSTMRSRIRTFLILTGLFFLTALFFFNRHFYYGRLTFDYSRVSLGQDLLLYINQWMPWVVCAPALIWLARRFPLPGRRWPLRLAVLIAGGLAVSTLESVLSFGLYNLVMESVIKLGDANIFYLKNLELTILTYFTNNFIVALAIPVVVWSRDYFHMYSERERAAGRLEAELAMANLRALKSQVHPHFLFNTLHMISAMVYEDPRKADGMISRLSDLLRAALEQPDTQTVPLKTELDMLSLYLDIMKARFGDRLAVAYEIAPDTLPALVPSFSLQPLVENAIKHGIMPRNKGGTITIAASRDDGRLVVGVADDGLGLKGVPEALMNKGLGLTNIKSRLLGLYGPDGVLSLRNRPEGGARVAFDIPFRTRDD
jgi:two-component system LytT family sensor kinase